MQALVQVTAAEDEMADWSQTFLGEHIGDYVTHLAGKDRTDDHIKSTKARIRRVCDGCQWVKLKDVSQSSFERWARKRTRRGALPRTRMTGLSAAPFTVGGYWHTFEGPALELPWWKNWEMSIGLGGGLAFGLAFYLFNRPEAHRPPRSWLNPLPRLFPPGRSWQPSFSFGSSTS